MNRDDLQELARARLREARHLLNAKQFPGAYHLAGLSVECAIKACIAKKIEKHQFPDKKFALQCYEHSPLLLAKIAGLAPSIAEECAKNAAFDANWSTVILWSVDSRYDHSILRPAANGLYSAVVARKHGVMSWLRERW